MSAAGSEAGASIEGGAAGDGAGGDATAIYAWQGALERDTEHPMLIKTRRGCVADALALVRGAKGPTEYDRMLAANSFGTKTVLLIALGGYALEWHSYLDVALLYAMVNFVANIAVMRFFEYNRPQDETGEPEGGA